VGLHLLRVQRATGQPPGVGQHGGTGSAVATVEAGLSLPPVLAVNLYT
jgi:hypothetical protein